MVQYAGQKVPGEVTTGYVRVNVINTRPELLDYALAGSAGAADSAVSGGAASFGRTKR